MDTKGTNEPPVGRGKWLYVASQFLDEIVATQTERPNFAGIVPACLVPPMLAILAGLIAGNVTEYGNSAVFGWTIQEQINTWGYLVFGMECSVRQELDKLFEAATSAAFFRTPNIYTR
jgi:hypothetical protein